MPRRSSLSEDGKSLDSDLDEAPQSPFMIPNSPMAEPSMKVGFTGLTEKPLAEEESGFGGTTLVGRSKTHHSSRRPKVLPQKSFDSHASFLQRAKTHHVSQHSRSKDIKDGRDTNIARTQTMASDAPATVPYVPGSGIARFRAAARKVILSKRGFKAEPGIDPRRSTANLQYGGIRTNCVIDIVDYSSVRSSFGKMENEGFVEYLARPEANVREPWVKVRWINIGGVSWDVMSALALTYDIHPLALEDVLHQRNSQARSKADYYNQHLFIRILRHSLSRDDFSQSVLHPFANPTVAPPTRVASPKGFVFDDHANAPTNMYEVKKLDSPLSASPTRRGTWISDLKNLVQHVHKHDMEQGPRPPLVGAATLQGQADVANALAVEELKRGDRVDVHVSPLYLFLLRDGTVISITSKQDQDFIAPILARLRQRDTVLRQTADPSLLIQSLLDLVVDQALEVVEAYQRSLLELEHDVLLRTQVKTVRSLHIISADLTAHKRTLAPIKTLIYGLRRYDTDRCAALLDGTNDPNQPVEGFMSHKAKIYLADVHDHMDHILSSMDMFSSVSENLINYTFNMVSYEMNNVMRRLTTATIIFLPLTLLTGYFGMNFTRQWSVKDHSDVFFWIVALPVMAIIVPAFLWSDLKEFYSSRKQAWQMLNMERRLKKNQ